MILPILTAGEASLREVSEPVERFDSDLKKLASNMFETMYQANGIGLAAPQVGRNIRMIVVDVNHPEGEKHPLVLINPEIIGAEGESSYDEGCLSIPGLTATVIRPEKITVRAQNVNGKTFELNCEDLLSRCIQHEIDHLKGVLFTDLVELDEQNRTLFDDILAKRIEADYEIL